MDNNQTAKSIIETIAVLRRQRKRPDRISIAKLVASKHGLSENMVISNVINLLNNAVIRGVDCKHNQGGGEQSQICRQKGCGHKFLCNVRHLPFFFV